jgi:hypothetical protein
VNRTNHERRALVRRALCYWRDQWHADSPVPLRCSELSMALPPEEHGSGRLHYTCMPVPSARPDALNAVRAADQMSTLCLSAVLVALQHATQKTALRIWTDVNLRHVAGLDQLGPLSYRHAVTIDFCKVCSLRQLLEAVRSAKAEVERHGLISLDLLWRATDRPNPPAAPQVSFDHLTLTMSPLSYDRVEAWPLFTTERAMQLQFYSWEARSTLFLAAAFAPTALGREEVRNLLADMRDVLPLLADTFCGALAMTPTSTDAYGDGLTIGGDHSKCYLCRRRAARQTVGKL